jgi:hypothetical protein
MRAAVVAAVVEAERNGTGARGAAQLLAEAGFGIAGTPYAAFLEGYFSS